MQPQNDAPSTSSNLNAESLHVRETPAGAVNLNVEGRQPQTSREGFGHLWQKTYRLPLRGAVVTPAEVLRVWKERLPDFQPPHNRVFTTSAGIETGELILINADTPSGPVDTGMLVIDASRHSFTLLTPEGHPEAGWITFSTFEADGVTIAQIESRARASDPIFEIGFRIFGATMQESIWHYVLTALAGHFGVKSDVTLVKKRLDTHLQWSRVANIRHNAQLHTLAYTVTAPVRKLFGRSRKGSRDGYPEL